MGVKRSITLSQLPKRYQHCQLIPTIDGVMASVYLLDDLYVLKIFEKETTASAIQNEITLMKSIKNLPTPKVIEHFKIEGHHALMYTQIQGSTRPFPTKKEIEKIATFLKDFHTLKIDSHNEQLFEKTRLQQLIENTQNQILLHYFNGIEIELQDNGVIHGDLFPDNCKFKEGELSGVYDFSDACRGDFHFELAVVAVSWCFEHDILNEAKVQTLLTAYGTTIDREKFQSYIHYALLYYATTRFISGHDADTLLRRLEELI